MGFFDSLSKAAKVLVDDLNTPESFKIGEKFEKYSREVIFPQNKYKLLKQTHDYSQNNKDYVDESKEPDFKFQCLETKKEFYVECKFRSYLYEGKIQFCKQYQFDRYKDFSKGKDVFVLIGVGEDPAYPDNVCLIPLDEIKSINLTESFLEKNAIPNNKPVFASKLWSLNSSKKSEKLPESSKKVSSGFCIRCKEKLDLNLEHPLCRKCYSEWSKYKNPDYKEKYCHSCGKSHETSILKPVCYNCFKEVSR